MATIKISERRWAALNQVVFAARQAPDQLKESLLRLHFIESVESCPETLVSAEAKETILEGAGL